MATQAPTAGGGGFLGPNAAWRATVWGEYLSEFLGTMVLIAFGCGVVAMYVVGLPGSGRGHGITTDGDWLLITFGWGMAVTFAIYVAGGISGAHINPAVTLAFATFRGFPWNKVPGYVIAQILGAVAGAAIVYANYRDAIQANELANHLTRDGAGTVGIFVTGPAGYFGNYWGPVVSEVTGTAFLILFVFAVVDLMNLPPKANLAPLIIGLAVFAIGMSYGADSGYAINPARDLGPRIFAWLMGWGKAAFPGDTGGTLTAYWWVPIVAPCIGAIIGGIFYDLGIANVLKARHRPDASGVESRGEVVEDE